MSHYDYKIKGSSKHFVDVMYSRAECKNKLFGYLCHLLKYCRDKEIRGSSRPCSWIEDSN